MEHITHFVLHAWEDTLPLVPFFIGWGIRRSVQKKKGSGQNYRTSTTGAHV